METDRTEYFSDAVFAIAITLLILEIRVPQAGPLGPALLDLWPSYLAYAISFIVVGAIWLNHHLMFAKIAKADGPLMIFNLMMLMAVAFLPFPTAVLAEALHRRTDQNIAAAFYGATLTIGGVFVNLTWRHAARAGLLISGLTKADIRRVSRRYLVGPTVYAFAAVIGWFVPLVAVAIYALLNLFYLWPRRHAAE
ncbi:MAG: TMEM175 family protein [Phenylobacterium sp.]